QLEHIRDVVPRRVVRQLVDDALRFFLDARCHVRILRRPGPAAAPATELPTALAAPPAGRTPHVPLRSCPGVRASRPPAAPPPPAGSPRAASARTPRAVAPPDTPCAVPGHRAPAAGA